MKLNTLFSVLVLAIVATVLVSPPAEAKRLGGFSFGKSYKYSRPAKPAAAPVQNTRNLGQSANTAGAAGRTGRGGMMGMLGGLAAGGLLGALFFGGAFENINFFDILLLGGLAFGAMVLMKSLRRSSATSAYQRQTSAAGPAGYQSPPAAQPTSSNRGFEIPEIGSGLRGEPLSAKPDWFDEQGFMAEAANHFHTLQKAWDSGNMELIREYTTPEFFEFISHERAGLPAQQETKITELNPQLLDLLQDGDKVVAAILFQGYEQEGNAAPEAFADIWHVEHSANDPDADWLLAGIRKLDDIQ